MGKMKDSIDMIATKSERYGKAQDLRHNINSPMHCDRCHAYFGFWRMMRYSFLRPVRKQYIIRCKCGAPNFRTKGMLRDRR